MNGSRVPCCPDFLYFPYFYPFPFGQGYGIISLLEAIHDTLVGGVYRRCFVLWNICSFISFFNGRFYPPLFKSFFLYSFLLHNRYTEQTAAIYIKANNPPTIIISAPAPSLQFPRHHQYSPVSPHWIQRMDRCLSTDRSHTFLSRNMHTQK